MTKFLKLFLQYFAKYAFCAFLAMVVFGLPVLVIHEIIEYCGKFYGTLYLMIIMGVFVSVCLAFKNN